MTRSTIRDFGTVGPHVEWSEPEHVRYNDLQPLGRFRDRRSFAVLPDGREVEVGAEMQPWEAYNRPDKGEIRIDRIEVRQHPLTKQRQEQHMVTIRGWIREPGTYARLVAADEAHNAKAAERAARASAPHRIDVAELLPQLDRVPEQPIAVGTSGDVLRDVMAKSPKLIVTGGRDAVRGVEAIAAWLAGHQVQLNATPTGQLDVRAKGISRELREVLDVFGSLLAAHIAGRPVPCALAHKSEAPAAYSLAIPATPVCREHLEELG